MPLIMLQLLALLSPPITPIDGTMKERVAANRLSEPPVERKVEDGEASDRRLSSPRYMWAYRRRDLPHAIEMARQQGFEPTGAAQFTDYLPDAGGPAWFITIRPRQQSVSER